MATCIVTGGAGFIGSHLTDQLITDGHSVYVVDNLLLGKREFINTSAVFHELDIRDVQALTNVFVGADVVFHLAAEPRLPISIEDPLGTHDINVTGTLNVLEAARKSGVPKVIFSSSCAVYGNIDTMPITERSDTKPVSPYGLHKLMGEEYMRLYSQLFAVQTVCLRYFNVFGPRKLAEGGYPMVIPIFLKQRAEGLPLTIVGTGQNTRDYVHVADVVAANIAAWKSSIIDGRPINIGTGRQLSVNDIAAMIGGDTTTLPPRLGEMERAEADITQAKALLDWEPRVSVEDGIAELKAAIGLTEV